MDRNQALVNNLIIQRDNAANAAVQLAADLDVANARIAELEARVKTLEPAPVTAEQ
jgi:hypothetical protein